MRQNQVVTFNSSDNNFESLNGQKIANNIKSNFSSQAPAEGTGRWPEDQPQKIELQIEPPKYKQQQQSQLLSSQINLDQSQKQNQKQIVSQLIGKPMEIINEKDSPTTPQKQSLQDNYISNSQKFHGSSCPQHPNREVQYACATLGCPWPSMWMCDECQKTHNCTNQMEASHFIFQLQQRINMQVDIDSEKEKIKREVQIFIKQKLLELQEMFAQIEISIYRKLLVEQNHGIELKSSFIDAIFSTNFQELSAMEQPTIINSKKQEVAKLLVNDFFIFEDLSRVFVQDRQKVGKKLLEIKMEITHVTQNYFEFLNQSLNGEVIHHSEDQIRLVKDVLTPMQQKLQIEQQMLKIKEVQKLTSHQGKHIIDFCPVSSTLFASASDTGDIIIWKVPQYAEICRFQHGDECTSLATCCDENKQRFLLSAGKDNGEYQIYIWNIDLRQKVGEVIGHSHPLRKVVPLSNFRIAWCCQDNNVHIWSLREKKEQFELKFHSAWINDICRISRNLIATCSRDYTVCVIEVQKQASARYIIKDQTYITCLTPINQELFAYGNYGGWVKVYQTEAAVEILQVQVYSNWLDSNCIWYMTKISENLIGVSGLDGQCVIVKISGLKKGENPLIKKLQIGKEKVSENIIFSNKQLIAADGATIKIYQ